MKVLHIHTTGNIFSGLETLLVTLARERHLCPEMEPQFALVRERNLLLDFEGRLTPELVSTGAKIHQLETPRLRYPWQVFRARSKLAQIIDLEGIDVVICHACWPQVMFGSVAKRLGKPLLFWYHSIYTGRSWLEKLARLIPPDLVIAVSQYTQGQIHRLYSNVPSRVVYAPVTAVKVEDSHLVRQRIRQKLGTPADTTVIIQVSRLDRLKGHSATIAALGEMRDDPLWECWMVGGVQWDWEQIYLEELQAQARQLGLEERIRFLGQRSDVADLLVAADIFCQSNVVEDSFGLVFIEALYAGLPVVTVAIGGGGEIVTSDCGYAVPPGQVGEITQALQELIQNPTKRQEFRTSAQLRAIELCDPQQQLAKLYRVIQEINV